MGDDPKDWAAIWSNVLQWGVILGAIVLGCVAIFVVSHAFGRIIIKLLLVGVPIAGAAAVAVGRKK